MKLVKAILKPQQFEFVKKALEDKNFVSMTVTEVRGRGEQRGISLAYRGGVMNIDMLPKTQIEIVAREKDAGAVINTIIESARTGKMGDGKIFVLPVERAIRIRTGETEV
ncbi:P-II family nitrogen regulator [Methanoregula sp.]|uniref:P-II family nitrogen regulator n=1 Tax=Methanoregula sp. TaxID=2052170 RepID=UPI003BAE71B5